MNVFGAAEEGEDKGEASGTTGMSVMVVQGCRKKLLMRSPAHGSASCGCVVTSNLGYKKDTFLEPSLVATTTHLSQQTNNHHSHPKPYQLIPCAMSTNNAQQSTGLFASAPGFNPSGHLAGPGVPSRGLAVDSMSQSTVAVAQGGYMSNNVFITTRGD